jgi:GTP-binding protein
LVSRKKNRKGVVILVNKWDLEKTMSTRDYEENGKLMPFTDVPILCIGFDQAAFAKSTRSYGKVYENRQQRIATFNEFMLKLSKRIRHQQPREICKIKYCMQLPTQTPQFVFFATCHNMLRNLQTLP